MTMPILTTALISCNRDTRPGEPQFRLAIKVSGQPTRFVQIQDMDDRYDSGLGGSFEAWEGAVERLSLGLHVLARFILSTELKREVFGTADLTGSGY